jgi:hypothetical protein
MPPLELDAALLLVALEVVAVLDAALLLDAAVVLETAFPPVPALVADELAPPAPAVDDAVLAPNVESAAVPQPEVNPARAQIVTDESFMGALHSGPSARSHASPSIRGTPA